MWIRWARRPAAIGGEVDVDDLRRVLEDDAALLGPSHDRADDGVVLVVLRAPHARQRVDARQLLHEAQDVALELDRAVPVLEGEGGPPHGPEVRLEEVLGEEVVDPACADQALRERDQPRHLGAIARVEAKIRGVKDAALAIDQARL